MASDKNNWDVDWEVFPDLFSLQADLTAAKIDQENAITKIKHYRNIIANEITPEKYGKGQSSYEHPVVKQLLQWRYPTLSEPYLSTPSLVSVKPQTPKDIASAAQHQMILNNQINTKIDKQKFIDKFVRKFVDDGTVFVKVRWNHSEETVKVLEPVYKAVETQDPKQIEEIQAAMALEDPANLPFEMLDAISMTTGTGVFHYPEYQGDEETEVMKTSCNSPVWEVCSTENIFVDPTCEGDLDKAQFLVHSFETTRSDLHKSGLYDYVDDIPDIDGPTSDVTHTRADDLTTFVFDDLARKKIIVYEYWGYFDVDDSGKTKPIVVSWCNDCIIRMEENPYPDGKIPFELAQFTYEEGSLYGEPEAARLETNQKMLGAIHRLANNQLARSAAGQTGIAEGAVDTINKQRFFDGENYVFNPNVAQGIIEHSVPELPASIFNLSALYQNTAESLTGVRGFQQGLDLNNPNITQAQLSSVLDPTSKRDMSIIRKLSACLERICRKTLAMNQAWLSEEEVVRITDTEFVPVRLDNLSGSYDVSISISTPEVNAERARQLSFMLQTIGPSLREEQRNELLAQIADLNDSPEFAQYFRQNQKSEDMVKLEMQEKMLQNREQEAKVLKLEAEAAKLMAEAKKLQSETDQRNLDYVEQESGVKHARDVDKQQAQAQGNMKLEALKHTLNNPSTKETSNV